MARELDILLTGGTGYVGRSLIPVLLARGHNVRVLTRASSAGRVPAGAMRVIGDALDAASVAGALKAGDTLIHLVGTPHPNPSKAKQFQEVDLVSIRAAVAAAQRSGVTHFVYVSVAQPAPVMRAFIQVRAQGETLIKAAGLTATILRPWYVLGPGHRWAAALIPLYKMAELFPSTRASARRLGLITIEQMVRALADAVANPPPSGQIYIVDVPAIRHAGVTESS
jgi:uncharacterized protein YbjT (DUF2867 family)